MQVNPKPRKYTHNRMKACIERNQNQDKENRICPPPDFRSKKFSAELPKHIDSKEVDQQRSIFNQQISVTLNTSNVRNSSGDLVSIDIKTLTHLLSKQKSGLTLKDLLSDEVDIKSFEVKMFLTRLLEKLRKEGSYECSMRSERESTRVDFNQSWMKPYIEKEIEELSANHNKLKQEMQFLTRIAGTPVEDKMRLLHAMKQQYCAQLVQLSQYDAL